MGVGLNEVARHAARQRVIVEGDKAPQAGARAPLLAKKAERPPKSRAQDP